MKHLVRMGVFCAIAIASAEEVRLRRGTLVFADGNRITGRLISDGVFASDRFGDVRFKGPDVRFEPDAAVPADDTPGGLRERVDAEVRKVAPSAPVREGESPAAHPWKIAISGFADRTTDDDQRRREYYGGIRAERPENGPTAFWIEARYEYRRVGDRPSGGTSSPTRTGSPSIDRNSNTMAGR